MAELGKTRFGNQGVNYQQSLIPVIKADNSTISNNPGQFFLQKLARHHLWHVSDLPSPAVADNTAHVDSIRPYPGTRCIREEVGCGECYVQLWQRQSIIQFQQKLLSRLPFKNK
jgi:hypothetical protein